MGFLPTSLHPPFPARRRLDHGVPVGNLTGEVVAPKMPSGCLVCGCVDLHGRGRCVLPRYAPGLDFLTGLGMDDSKGSRTCKPELCRCSIDSWRVGIGWGCGQTVLCMYPVVDGITLLNQAK